MRRRLIKGLVCISMMALLAAWLRSEPLAHESPVDQVLRKMRIWVEGDRVLLRYEETLSERSAILELHAMDLNRDGVIQDDEREGYLSKKAQLIAAHLNLEVAGKPLAMSPRGPVALHRGWVQVHVFQASLDSVPDGTHLIRLKDDNTRTRPGQLKWTLGRPDGQGDRSPSKRKARLNARKAPEAGSGGDAGWINLELVLAE